MHSPFTARRAALRLSQSHGGGRQVRSAADGPEADVITTATAR